MAVAQQKISIIELKSQGYYMLVYIYVKGNALQNLNEYVTIVYSKSGRINT